MAVKKKEEIINAIKERIGDDVSDAAISLLEDVTDTLSSFEKSSGDTTDWKAKFEENDKQWRERYKERFMGKVELDDEIEKGSNVPPVPEQEEEKDKYQTYEDLFSEKKED